MNNEPICISRTRVGLVGHSWCGKDVRGAFYFIGADHAAENGINEGRLVACPQCVEAVTEALRVGVVTGGKPCTFEGGTARTFIGDKIACVLLGVRLLLTRWF